MGIRRKVDCIAGQRSVMQTLSGDETISFPIHSIHLYEVVCVFFYIEDSFINNICLKIFPFDNFY